MKLIALLGAVLVALSAAVLPIANPANAQPCTGTVVNIDGCRGARSVTVSGSQPDPGRTSTPPTGRPNTPPSLTVTCGTSAERELTNLGDRLPAVAGSTCQSQRIICRATEKAENRHQLRPVVTVQRQPDGNWNYTGNDCIAATTPHVTPELARQTALRLIPHATIGLAPHGTTLVNIDTIMWTTTPRHRTLPTATILGHTITITTTLDHVSWHFGDGETTADGPAGKPYDHTGNPCRTRTCPHYFGHTYHHTGHVTLSATAYWHATFTVTGSTPTDIPGTITGPPAHATITVKQAHTVLVPNPHGGD